MNRPVENAALQKSTAVSAAIDALANIGGIVDAARGNAMIGATGEGGIMTYPTWPEIDPETGEAVVEPSTPTDYFRAGDKVGIKVVKP